MANTTITPGAGALAATGVLVMAFRGYSLITLDQLKLGQSPLDVWQATPSPALGLSWPLPAWWKALYYSARKHINGNVQDSSGAPLVKTVYAIDEATGFRVADPVVSEPVAGAFTCHFQSTAPVILIAVADAGDQRNDPVLDRIVPV